MCYLSVRLTPLIAVAAMMFASLPACAQFAGAGGVAAPSVMPVPAFGFGMHGGYGMAGGYGWGTQWMQNPYEGYLNGAANMTIANAQYQQTIQQAKLTREQAKRSSLETRRAALLEHQFELSLQPDPEQIRQQRMMKRLQRSRNNPPAPEIWSGVALNDLLRDIQSSSGRGATGPNVSIDPNVLKHVNMSTGTTYGSAGLLRDGGKQTWPNVLRSSAFSAERQELDELLPQAVKEAQSGQVSYDVTSKIDKTIKQLEQSLDAQIADLTPGEFTETSRYLRELKNSTKVLKQNDAAKYFRPQWTPQGSTVADLVQQMTREGLQFAPAVSGDETYYTALHRALVDYDTGIAQLTATMPQRGMIGADGNAVPQP